MSTIQTFTHKLFGETRIIREGDSFVAVAKDIVEKVGNTWTGHALDHVPEQWKGVVSVTTPGGVQEIKVLHEQGVYFYLGRCDKPAALPYQMWIAGEVVPSLRKNGVYGVMDAPCDSAEHPPPHYTPLPDNVLDALREEAYLRGRAEERLAGWSHPTPQPPPSSATPTPPVRERALVSVAPVAAETSDPLLMRDSRWREDGQRFLEKLRQVCDQHPQDRRTDGSFIFTPTELRAFWTGAAEDPDLADTAPIYRLLHRCHRGGLLKGLKPVIIKGSRFWRCRPEALALCL